MKFACAEWTAIVHWCSANAAALAEPPDGAATCVRICLTLNCIDLGGEARRFFLINICLIFLVVSKLYFMIALATVRKAEFVSALSQMHALLYATMCYTRCVPVVAYKNRLAGEKRRRHTSE